LVVFVAMLSLLNVPCGLRLWGPALGVAAACIVIGAVLMDPERLKRNPGGDIPFASTETPSDSQPNQPPTTAGAAIARQDLRPFPPVATALQTEPGKATADGGSQASLVWHPLVSADQQGRASVRVQLPARPGSCRILLDAHAESGRLGGSSTPVTYSMPFRLEPRVPAVVSVGDRMDVPVGIVNDSDHRLTIQLSVEHGPSVRIEGESRRTLELAPRHRADEHLILHALGPQGDCSLRFHAKSGDLTADATRAVTIRAAGYPAEWSSSGRIEGRKEMLVRLPDPLPPGSVDAQLLLFPSLAADAQTAMDALAGGHATDLDWAAALSGAGAIVLRELASDWLADPVLIRLAKERNQAAESARSKCVCPTGGYDRFGVDPGCEATTALAVWQVGQASDGPSADPAFARGLKWLLDRRDGSGGFVRGARPQRAAQDWLARHKETVDAYILWALTESGQRNLEAELNRALESAAKSDDPYRLALVAKAALNSGRKTEARPLLDKLAKLQLPDGHLVGAASITASGGASLAVETTALATLAWLGLPQYASQADRATGWIVEHRDASGTFGAPHATLLALTALAADARRDRAARREGKCVIQRAEETRRAGSPVRAEAGRVGDPTYVAVAEQTISAGQRATVGIGGWQGRLVSGENRLAVELAGAGPMPYLLAVRYRSAKPPGDPACPVRLAAKLARANAKVGQAVPLEVQLVNATDRGLPMVVAIIGFPAGMEVRSERLDAMRQSGTLDAYKVRTGELVCCWRSLAPKATAIVQLDLAAVSAGKFTGSASRAYLHDTPESKHWVEPLAIEITRE
jgi:hypothetical protein